MAPMLGPLGPGVGAGESVADCVVSAAVFVIVVLDPAVFVTTVVTTTKLVSGRLELEAGAELAGDSEGIIVFWDRD